MLSLFKRQIHRVDIVLLLPVLFLYGCSEAPTSEPPVRDSFFEVLGVNPSDLEGVDVEALMDPIDTAAIVEAIRTNEQETETSLAAGKNGFVRRGQSIQKAIDNASAGSIVFIGPGTYKEALTITRPLHLIGIGAPGTVIIQDPGGEENGIFARDVTGLSLINLTIRGFSGNGVFFIGVNGFLLNRLFTDQLRVGAYGLFPVRSKNGLITNCTAVGANDAGIYIGQSENVAVLHNKAYGNVIGFEAENVRQTVWAFNRGYENAAGMLAILLPPSRYISVIYADRMVVSHNRFTDNNEENFAEAGELASFVPSGTGLLVIGYDGSSVSHNRVTGNGFVGIGLGSTVTLWTVAGRDPADLATIDPFPDKVRILHNQVTGNGFAGSPLPLPGVDLLWDRTLFENYGSGNCWKGNTYNTSFPEDLPSCNAAV